MATSTGSVETDMSAISLTCSQFRSDQQPPSGTLRKGVSGCPSTPAPHDVRRLSQVLCGFRLVPIVATGSRTSSTRSLQRFSAAIHLAYAFQWTYVTPFNGGYAISEREPTTLPSVSSNGKLKVTKSSVPLLTCWSTNRAWRPFVKLRPFRRVTQTNSSLKPRARSLGW